MNDQLSDKKRISQLENDLKEYRQLVIALEKRIKQLEGRQAESPLIVGEYPIKCEPCRNLLQRQGHRCRKSGDSVLNNCDHNRRTCDGGRAA